MHCSGAALVPARFPVQPLGRRAKCAHHAAILRLAGGADAGRGGHAARRNHPAQRRQNRALQVRGAAGASPLVQLVLACLRTCGTRARSPCSPDSTCVLLRPAQGLCKLDR